METTAVNLKQIAVLVPVENDKVQVKFMPGLTPADFLGSTITDAFLEQNLRNWQAIITYNLHSIYVNYGHIGFNTIADAEIYLDEKIKSPAQPKVSETAQYIVVGFWLGSKTSTTRVKATFDFLRDAKKYAKELAQTSSERRCYGVFVLDSVYVPSQSVQVECS